MTKKTIIILILLLNFQSTWTMEMEYDSQEISYNAQASQEAHQIFLGIWDLAHDKLTSYPDTITAQMKIDTMCEIADELMGKSSYNPITRQLVRNKIYSAFIPQIDRKEIILHTKLN